jgi:hypothetical protein
LLGYLQQTFDDLPVRPRWGQYQVQLPDTG